MESFSYKFCWYYALVTRLMVKVVPWFTLLATDTVPPICSIIRLQILRPRPVPYAFILECSSSMLKFMKSFPRFSSFIPTPQSTMSILSFMYFSQFEFSFRVADEPRTQALLDGLLDFYRSWFSGIEPFSF